MGKESATQSAAKSGFLVPVSADGPQFEKCWLLASVTGKLTADERKELIFAKAKQREGALIVNHGAAVFWLKECRHFLIDCSRRLDFSSEKADVETECEHLAAMLLRLFLHGGIDVFQWLPFHVLPVESRDGKAYEFWFYSPARKRWEPFPIFYHGASFCFDKLQQAIDELFRYVEYDWGLETSSPDASPSGEDGSLKEETSARSFPSFTDTQVQICVSLIRASIVELQRPWLRDNETPLYRKLDELKAISRDFEALMSELSSEMKPPITFDHSLPAQIYIWVSRPTCPQEFRRGYLVGAWSDNKDVSPCEMAADFIEYAVTTLELWLTVVQPLGEQKQNAETVGGDITTNAEQEGTPGNGPVRLRGKRLEQWLDRKRKVVPKFDDLSYGDIVSMAEREDCILAESTLRGYHKTNRSGRSKVTTNTIGLNVNNIPENASEDVLDKMAAEMTGMPSDAAEQRNRRSARVRRDEDD